MTETRELHCCGCGRRVEARLTTGAEVYPHRADLADLPFWRCDACGNWVGCHHKTKNRTSPLGVISTPEIKNARRLIHARLDPIWQNGVLPRGRVYAMIAERMGTKSYHTGSIRSIEEARRVYRAVLEIEAEGDGEVIE